MTHGRGRGLHAAGLVALAISLASSGAVLLRWNGPWGWLALVAGLVASGLWLLRGPGTLADDRARHERELQHLRDDIARLHRLHEQQGQLEQQLVLAKQAAEAAVLAKGEFLATMSHEIRTPLNGIIPMLDLIGRGNLEPAQRQMLATAAGSSQQLLRIVDDILDHSRLEANALVLETTTFNLRELLEGVVQLMQRAAEAKGLRILLELDPAVRLSVRGDPVRLRQVLGNLVSNAIKFTARGQVTLKVRRLGETPFRHELRFEVVDTGIGIAPEQQSRLFQSFSQADASTTRVYGGTGLGLAICRRIVELMQGRIGVDSRPAQGASFWFEIPLLKALGDTRNGHGPELGTLLLLSDDPIVQQRVQRVGAQHGLQVRIDHTLAVALEAVRTPSRSLSWLVIDGRLLRNGDASVQRALAERGLEAPQVLWLHMGNAPPRDGQHWVDELAVDASLHAVLVPTETPSARPDALLGDVRLAPAAPAAPEALDLRVLLVEDNMVNLMVAQRVLEVMGCAVRTAHDGEQALRELHAGGIDVVLMDCQMPVLDGYAATRQWRAHEAEQRAARLPIIAMTANAMAGDRERCLQAGMDDYLSKPVELATLRAMLLRWSHGATDVTPGAADILREGPPAEAGDEGPQPVLDASVLDELHGVIGASTQAIIDAFLHDTPGVVQQLQDAASADDQQRLRGLAHSLKSSSANVGASALSAAARRIELEARNGTLERPTVAAARVVTEFARARMALAGWRPSP